MWQLIYPNYRDRHRDHLELVDKFRGRPGNTIQTSKSHPARLHVLYIINIGLHHSNSGVPAVVDLAAMRDAMNRLGGDP